MSSVEEDRYGLIARFHESTDDELISAFNSQVGVNAWVTTRAHYLSALRLEMLSRDFYFSLIADEGGLKLKRRVRRIGNQLEYVDC
ncbi:hypothetical protein Pla22_36970 [Rubripirellula amarantea]|uniref:Uncharacterized protein n=1 Tax=Rubripirellula amarantea TaxID=2527999 RepID=A0A5C5WJG3_9BACT|nr:hypothetical protein [Rubripirellula amarantea]TWT50954.1 hypothetical protein Pla22_36970 [Rubripirellula amarantea]